MKIDFEVKVISKEMIKPSIPTPEHRRYHQLSFLDQLCPPIFAPLIYFYNLDNHKLSNNIEHISNRLKESLSRVLTHYYPFAGRLQDNFVDCNDEGALFLEAKLNCKLSEIMQNPVPSDYNKLLLPSGYQKGGVVIAIQLNLFSCGSVAIGVVISHKLADGLSFLTFIKNWAAVAASASSGGDDDYICPEVFVAAAGLFPPKNIAGLNKDFLSKEKNIVLKRFVFSSSRISDLQLKYADRTSPGIHPSRVQTLSAFIWNRFAVSTRTKVGPERPWKLLHTVNLRRRMDQPLPEDSIGNIVWGAVAVQNSNPEDTDPTALVKKMRDAISQVNKDSVMKHINYIIGISDHTFNTTQEVTEFYYTSLCRFPLYEADFGWGRPQWVAWGGMHRKNLVVFMDTKSGDGIEAWIHLTEEDMAKFEADKKLLAYVSSIS